VGALVGGKGDMALVGSEGMGGAEDGKRGQPHSHPLHESGWQEPKKQQAGRGSD
jgi:hypothetical protein